MPMKEASERLRQKAQNLKEDVASLVSDVGESVPRPFTQRPTVVLKQPLMKTIRERLASRKKKVAEKKAE